MCQLVRGYVGQVDELIELFAVAWLALEHAQRLVYTVEQQAGLTHALHAALQLAVSHPDLGVHAVKERVQALERLLQLVCHRVREARQRPGDIAVVFKQQTGIVEHHALLLGSGGANFFAVNVLVGYYAAARQEIYERIGFRRLVCGFCGQILLLSHI